MLTNVAQLGVGAGLHSFHLLYSDAFLGGKRSPDNCLCVVGDHRAGEKELWAQQGLMGTKAGQTGVKLLPDLADPEHRALHEAISCPNSRSQLGGAKDSPVIVTCYQ